MKRWQAITAIVVAVLVAVIAFAALSSRGVDDAMSTATAAGAQAAPTTTVDRTSTTSPTTAPTTLPGTSPTLAPPGDGERAVVTRVKDGDTIDVDILGAGTDTVRLIGINTPESGECFADEATQALEALLSDEVFTMTSDVSDRDQYDRLLRYLWLDRGVFVNEIMVRGGFAQARDYPPDSAYAEEIATAQELAQADGIGLWAPDACGPAADDDLRIIEVFPNPDGPDDENLNGEWVDIVNAGAAPASLQGWVLKDESSSHRYRFTDGFELGAQSVVRVHTGCGDDTPEDVYWCNGSPVWNNDGDTAFLLDPNGNVISTYSY